MPEKINLPKLETQTVEFKSSFNDEVIITGQVQNIQKWQYPLEAIREIVLNMIIHRDYTSSSDSIIKIFNEKIEFYNPGRLPENITIKDLLSNNYKSTPRNKSIADFFKCLGWIEKYGSGIGRIRSYLKEAGLPEPDFTNISDGFQVTVFAQNNVQKKKLKTVEKSSEKSSEKILNLINDNPHITINELSSILRITTRAVEKNLTGLKSKGIIKRIGPDNGGRWMVIHKKE